MSQLNFDYINEKVSNGLIIIKNFFIDETIIINDNKSFLDNIKPYILKYRKIIAVILLLILVIIPFCDSNNKSQYDKHVQYGGAALPVIPLPPPPSDVATAAAKVDSTIASTGTVKQDIDTKSKDLTKSKVTERLDKLSAGKDKIIKKFQDKGTAKEQIKSSLTAVPKKMYSKASTGVSKLASKKSWKSAGSSAFNFGNDMADRFKAKSSVIYRLIYTIAFTLILAIIFLPSIGFFIVGIICYFILQKRINYLKEL
jgi:hypothetical protein